MRGSTALTDMVCEMLDQCSFGACVKVTVFLGFFQNCEKSDLIAGGNILFSMSSEIGGVSIVSEAKPRNCYGSAV